MADGCVLQIMLRWQEFSQEDQQQFAAMVFTLFKTVGDNSSGWVARSKASLLISLIAKRMGQAFWEQLLPELIRFAAEGPTQAEKVAPHCAGI